MYFDTLTLHSISYEYIPSYDIKSIKVYLLKFFLNQVSEKDLPADVVEKMKLEARPKFVVWKAGVPSKTINGVLINEIEAVVQKLLPENDD